MIAAIMPLPGPGPAAPNAPPAARGNAISASANPWEKPNTIANYAADHDADCAAARAVLTGDRGAFAHFIRTHQKPVYSLLLRLLKSAEDAEDLTQETFIKAFRALGHWDNRRPFRPWLYQIARNTAISHLRRGKPQSNKLSLDHLTEHAPSEFSDPPDPANSALRLRERLAQEDDLALVRKAIATLSPEDQTLIQLHYLDELPSAAIAEALDQRPNTITVRLHRLRQRLRRMLQTSPAQACRNSNEQNQ